MAPRVMYRMTQARWCFGERLREHRKTAAMTLSVAADVVGVKVSYMSDVELGNRKPFETHHVMALAAAFRLTNAATEELARLAAVERGGIRISANTHEAMQMLSTLARLVDDLSAIEVQEIQRLLSRVRESGSI